LVGSRQQHMHIPLPARTEATSVICNVSRKCNRRNMCRLSRWTHACMR
jgi:hypothetical protein